MRIVVLGAGGVGGYFGGKLAAAGEDVTFVARGAHLEALRRDGLRVRSAVDGESVVKVTAAETLDGRPTADVVLVCVKTYDTEDAVAKARPVVGPDTAVLSLQNGVESLEVVDRLLGRGHAVGGAAYVFATIEAPGVIVHRLGGKIVFGETSGTITPRAERFRTALEKAGIPCELTTEIVRALWEKYLLITAQAGMTAVTRCPVGVIRALPATWTMYRRILEELAAVAAAAGIALAPDTVDRIVQQASALGADAYSSLYHDLTHGKRLELEALHGHAVRLGERFGVPTPTVFAVYAALLPHAAGGRG
jgi:2-dehydropantoate 2-reductase